jgi:dTMP kinase
MIKEPGFLKNFIVLEGLDGSGTTTQLENLHALLNQSIKTCEPTRGPVGKLIRSLVREAGQVHPGTIAGLFAADRFEHLYGKDGIVEQTKRGRRVLSDRYLFSSLAYQGTLYDFDAVLELNKSFPLPEHLIFIDVPIEECQRRIHQRDGGDIEIFEQASIQKKLLEGYERSFSYYESQGGVVHRIPGTESREEITKRILNLIA